MLHGRGLRGRTQGSDRSEGFQDKTLAPKSKTQEAGSAMRTPKTGASRERLVVDRDAILCKSRFPSATT